MVLCGTTNTLFEFNLNPKSHFDILFCMADFLTQNYDTRGQGQKLMGAFMFNI